MTAARPAACPVIGLVRHASSTWTGLRYAGRSDPPLSPDGVREARDLAVRVAASGLLADPAAVIVTSPLRRALDTARAVATVVDRPVLVADGWVEVDFGELEGRTFDEAMASWPDAAGRLAAGDGAIDWPGGETHEALLHRVATAFAEAAAHPGPVLVVCHGIVLRAALVAALGADEALAAGRPDPARLFVLHRAGDGWRLERSE